MITLAIHPWRDANLSPCEGLAMPETRKLAAILATDVRWTGLILFLKRSRAVASRRGRLAQ
jgi:hypothetical protein